MAASDVVTGSLATARRLVELLEKDGWLDAAVWVPEEGGHGRLYLVPHERSKDHLRQMIQVASAISKYKEELPDRHDLQYSVVDPDDPIVRAVLSVHNSLGKVSGAYKDGTYVDTAYVLRSAA